MPPPTASPEVVRELFKRFAAGERVPVIVRSLAERGYVIPRTTAQNLLRRQYAREIVGEELFQHVQDMLDDSGRLERHMLGRCVNCSICGRVAEVFSRPSAGPHLRCFKKGDHSISTSLEFAEQLVERFVLANIRDPRFGELAQNNDPVRAWRRYTIRQKREVIRHALYIELRRTPPGRGYDPHALKIDWKK